MFNVKERHDLYLVCPRVLHVKGNLFSSQRNLYDGCCSLTGETVLMIGLRAYTLRFEPGCVVNFKCKTNVSFTEVNKERCVYLTYPRNLRAFSTSITQGELLFKSDMLNIF